MPLTRGVGSLVTRLATIGTVETDDETTRAQKATLVLATVFITTLAPIWVGTYLALGLGEAAAIPFAYQVLSIAGLVVFRRSKDFRVFRFGQAALITTLPFALQWVLGGYVASSAVSLWALVASIGTLFFFTADESIPWFGLFLALTVLSGLLEPSLAGSARQMPDVVRITFFVLNVTGVSVTAYVLLQYAVRARDEAFARSESILLNVLPRAIVRRLKHQPGVIAESHDDVTVLFADVVAFTPFVHETEPERVVNVLNEIFTAFDGLAQRHGVEKIKTIGDAYMVAAGLPDARPDHATAMAEMALDMREDFALRCPTLGLDLSLRIGIASGPVIAGVIGKDKFAYDLWGDTVNTASRMESHGLPDRIQVSDATYRHLRDRYVLEDRGEIDMKGKGRIRAYLLVGRLPSEGRGRETRLDGPAVR